MPGVFVTATGTDVGKTYVSAGLIRACRRAGRKVAALKPVVSGYDEATPAGSDTAALLDAMGVPLTPDALAAVSPWRFKAPLSPDMAAGLEGRPLVFDPIVARCRAALDPGHLTIIEGVGGVMVPLGPGVTILDMMQTLALPIVLVSPTALGALSHLLTALEALKSRDLVPAAIVLSESEGSSVPLDLTLATLDGFVPRQNRFVLRRTSDGQDSIFDAILAGLDTPVSTDL